MLAGPKGKVSALAGRWLLALWLCALLSACADRRAAIEAATALVEAAYPGQLELVDTHLQKDHYDVVFAMRDDPFTRIRFGVDRDASRCRPASPCEDRLHRAYAAGVSAGAKLRALNAAFRRCGVVPLAVGFGQRLALFQHHQMRKRVLMLQDQLEPVAQPRRAFGGWPRAPGAKRALGGLDRLPRLLRAHHRHRADRRPIGRVEDRLGLRVQGIAPAPVDIGMLVQQGGVAHLREILSWLSVSGR